MNPTTGGSCTPLLAGSNYDNVQLITIIMTLAFILIIAGLLFFLKNAGLIPWSWHTIWPLGLIALGLYVAWVSRKVSAWLRQTWGKVSKKLE